VERGQREAARSLGLSRSQTLRKVTLPQAARLMIRPLGVDTVALIKGSTLVSTISVVELTYTAQRFIGSTYKPFEMFAIAAALGHPQRAGTLPGRVNRFQQNLGPWRPAGC